METIYYSIDARHITACGQAEGRRASGGQETVCYACVPTGRPAGGEGKILEFAKYRPVEPAGQQPQEPPEPGLPESAPPEGRPRRLWALLDLCASAAVIAVALGAIVRFFLL